MANARIVNTPSQAIKQDGTTHTQITVGSSSAALSASLTLNASTTHVLLQFNNANARVTFDGATAATSTKGFLYTDGSSAYWTRQMFNSARAIRTASTDVVVEVQELNYL
jgi:hypothetical protein